MADQPVSPALEPAELRWSDGVPESVQFGDVYFSRDDGLAETRHVFLDGNNLPQRFRALPAGSHFVIAETGFGTGLNFLSAWKEWLDQRPGEDKGILHFVSVERYPLTREDLARALELWPALSDQADELIRHYPPLLKGTHRLVLAGGRVRLTLYFGDVLDAWQALDFQADAWFLDGFAPAKNPDMWLEQAIKLIRQHSRPGSTLATFTAVGRIRRALAGAGFAMAKVPGFGRKRDMLTGHLDGPAPASVTGDEPIVIVGAGIAGTTLARNLADRGLQVILLDRAREPGEEASGNPQGALYVKLGIEYNAQTELSATALAFSQRFYQPWQGQFWHPTGLLQLATTEQEADRQRRFLARNRYPEQLLKPVNPEQASELAGLPVESDGLWFPGSGWLEPARACRTLAQHDNIERRFGHQVSHIERQGEHWLVHHDQGEPIRTLRLVVAGGHQSASLLPEGDRLRLKNIRGQISSLPAARFNLPDIVISGTKYLNPAHGDHAVTGATFDLHDDNPSETPESHRHNLQELRQMLPAVVGDDTVQPDTLTGRVSFRCTTHDYQPAAGPLSGAGGSGPPGLYLLGGFGSKGLAWAPLLAEHLADCLTGQPSCLPAHLCRRVQPNRLYPK
ncbi:bifunctional tRNA (5-methylaminomethyl-2-thiouridine)(34)-methyltransferase MnmD/FAD-dependent 5-carboxymethylaminomethyl-2-thiouridine(34) oxidoreductase MnmC [Marinobacter oulmenensis]|uniref:tRNA 5-methylaminomethyl-2-thiouridine biosynthesis bifunctional protein MnmC n=1 Tax=Marinobacter oulmenensis TaxID=643747 RepID=A0A840U636_9GAMM|nr:bifunctional tRNA (5-methylaminomethyl-2-thiouridine)(34)-methyltransferase MnmD/FAD-dependent 5-carboxymethylaminomethyl-2-thiouridine(34) oxidoreductase MnmC [Marinobacter oulmenensis]MBB5320402.1 tRNA 5-methylaminomethyl-2-thiouridine biosynthesis bifunctional protein [Marinobacter oulmenensis]